MQRYKLKVIDNYNDEQWNEYEIETVLDEQIIQRELDILKEKHEGDLGYEDLMEELFKNRYIENVTKDYQIKTLTIEI